MHTFFQLHCDSFGMIHEDVSHEISSVPGSVAINYLGEDMDSASKSPLQAEVSGEQRRGKMIKVSSIIHKTHAGKDNRTDTGISLAAQHFIKDSME